MTASDTPPASSASEETAMSDNSIEQGRQIAMAMMDRAEARWRHEHKQAHNRAHCELCAPEFECPACERWSLWTDGQMAEDGDGPDEFWCQTCGAESLLANCARREQETANAR